MKYLQKKDINEVDPFWRKTVKEAWKNGEDVPHGVIYLTNPKTTPLTKDDIEWSRKLAKKI